MLLEMLERSSQSKVSDILDLVIPFLDESDFVLTKNFKVKQSTDISYGKWPQTLGNAFFIDSRFILPSLIDMITNNVDLINNRNGLQLQKFTSEFNLILKKQNIDVNEFAMQVIGHVDERVHSYIHELRHFDKKIAKLQRIIGLDSGLAIETPLVSQMDQQQFILMMLNNVLVTVIFFVCLLAFILTFSLMQTDIEEQSYEFAVLRTLGLRNKQVITLVSVQTLIYALPGIICGYVAMMDLSISQPLSLKLRLIWT